MSSKNTPGPWHFEPSAAEHDQHAIFADQGGGGPWRAVATVHTGRLGGGSKPVQPAEADANARLIAAAPDLLAACEAAVASNPLRTGKPQISIDEDAWAAIRAAIASATGE